MTKTRDEITGALILNEKNLYYYLAERGVVPGRMVKPDMGLELRREFIRVDDGRVFTTIWDGHNPDVDALLDWADIAPEKIPDSELVVKDLVAAGYEPWARIRAILAKVGNQGACRGCDRPIWWVGTVPYSAAGVNHFIDCGNRDQFKKKGRGSDCCKAEWQVKGPVRGGKAYCKECGKPCDVITF